MRARKGERAVAAAVAAIGALGMFSRQVRADNDLWLGNSSTAGWNDQANWSDTTSSTTPRTPVSGDTLEFGVAGSAGLTLLDNLMTPGAFSLGGITFDANAGAFVINPATAGTNGFTLGAGGITDNSTLVEIINDAISLSGTPVFTVNSAGLSLGGVLSGSGIGFNKTGTGTLTLSGTNTYTGATTLTAGTLVMANTAALGATSTLTFAGGATGSTWDIATDGGDTAYATNFGTGTTLTIASDVKTGNLGINHTLGTMAAGGGTVNIVAGPNVTGGSPMITIPVLQLTSGTSGAVTTFNPTTANLSIGSASIVLNNSPKTLNLDGTSTGNLVTGALSNGLNTLSVTKTNTSIWALNGANTYTGTTTVNAGTLNYNGSLTAGSTFFVDSAGTNAVLNIATGAGALTITNATSMEIGNNATGAGAVYQSGGTLNLPATTGANMQLGSALGGSGYYNLSGGGTLVMNEVDIGGTNVAGINGTGVIDMTSGTMNINAWITVSRGSAATFQTGILNMTGGTINVLTTAGAISMGWGGLNTSVINITNSNLLAATGQNVNLDLNRSGGTGSQGIVNINSGGTLQIGNITADNTTATTFLNLNGGTLKAAASTTTFLTSGNITGVNVYAGGGTIDNNGFAVTVSRPIGSPTGSGLSSIPLANGGSGYISPPAISISGGSGLGATGYATINPATGQVTGIVVTNPGTGYNSSDSLSVNFSGGGASTPATIGAFSASNFVTNTSGAVTFAGAGTTTLTGASTYTGATNISGGVTLSGTGGINGSSGITINGLKARLLQLSSVAVAPTVTLTAGTVDGTGTINSLNIANSSSAILATGNGTNAPLTIGTLTFNGAATVNLKTSLAGATAAGLVTTTLNTASTPLNITDFTTAAQTVTTTEWANGTYNLIGYSTLNGAGFTKGTLLPAVGGRQSATLQNSGAFVQLVIAGDFPVWTGLTTGGAAGHWTTIDPDPVNMTNENWKLSVAGTPTNFLANDVTLFDDTATGTTSVNISDANVTPTSTTFNNSTLNYTVSSTGGFGIASGTLIKNGTAAVTLATSNTYTGNTTMIAGTLNINNASAIGLGALTINGGTLDNTSGGAITLSTNNVQNWNADFAFGGTNGLNLGTGAVTMGASRTITTNGAAALTVGGAIGDGGNNFGLTKTGPGALTLSGINTYTGATALRAGTTTLTGTINSAGVAGVGSLAVGNLASTTALLNISGGTINVGSAAISVGSAAGAVGSVVMGSGTVNVLGALPTTQRDIDLGTNGYGAFTLTGGNVNISGFLVGGITTANAIGIWNIGGTGAVTINNTFAGTLGATANTTGLMNITGGSYSSTSTAAGAGLYVGENGTGFLNVSGTGALNLGGAAGSAGLSIGRTAAGAVGTVNLGAVGVGGGTINTVRVTKGGGSATFNFHGGTLKALPTAAATFMTGLTNAFIWNEGGTIDNNGVNITVGQNLLAPITGTGVTAIGVTGGTGYVNTPFVSVTGGTVAAGGTAATAVATINYSTGAITGITITNPGNYTSTTGLGLTFSGGGGTAPTAPTFTTAADTGGALILNGIGQTTLSGANTYPGGTTLNAGTLNINNASALGTGTFTLAAGTIDNTSGAPITLATNNAQNWNADVIFGGTQSLNLGTGNVTLGASRIITTNGAGTLTVGGAIAGSALNLTKAGTGSLALAGVNSYSGATTIGAGTLLFTGGGASNSSSGITINGSGAKLLQTSSVAVSPTVTLTNGTIDGTGTLNSVIVANSASNIIANGNGLTGSALTINSLTFNGAATLNLNTSALTPVLVTSNLTDGAGTITVNATNTAGTWTTGTYDLIQYAAPLGGTGFSDFMRGNVPGVTNRQSATLSNIVNGANSFIALVIAGDSPVWTGAQNGNWTTATIGGLSNWKLQTAGTPTDFITGDTVVFDDSATGTTTVNVLDNTVTPTSTTFNNSAAKPYTLSSTGGFGITSGFLMKNGLGSLTITNANTYSGNTTLTNGTLNINNAAAIGTGNFIIAGGTIDNTSGAPITMTANNPQTWNANVTFAGSSDLNMGTGAVTLTGNRTVTVNGSTLTEGGIIGDGGSGFSITKTGTGALALNGASTFTGGFAINGGTVIAGNNNALGASTNPLSIANAGSVLLVNGRNLNVGALTGDANAVIQNSNATGGSLVVNTSGSSTYAGALQDGTAGTLGFTVSGTGTQNLSGTSNTYTGVTTVTGSGTLNVTGAIPASATIGSIIVGNSSGGNAQLTISGGTVSTNLPALPANQFTSTLVIGNVASSVGDVQMSSGTLTVGSQFGIGNGAGATAVYTQTGGTATSGSYIVVGFNNDRAVYNQSNGSMTVNSNVMTIAAGGTGSVAVANFSGGTFTSNSGSNSGIFVGERGLGILNVSGTASLSLGTNGLNIGPIATQTGWSGIANLLGGTVTTNKVSKGVGTGTAVLNFNGGTLQAGNTPATPFISGLDGAYVYSGGAVIDTNGNDITISQPLLAPTGTGVTSVLFSSDGTGYKDTPLVQVTGGTVAAGGAPATAVANINYATGHVTGVTITNPGNYTSTAGLGLSFTGGSGTLPIVNTINTAASVSGGLTKVGNGTLTLSGTPAAGVSFHNYGGATVISGGTLKVLNALQPIASYSFDGSDPLANAGSGGNTMEGNLVGDVDTSQPGKFGNGATFNGDGSNIQINSPITNLGSANTWTVSAWIKTTQPGATLFAKTTGGVWSGNNEIFYLDQPTATTSSAPTSTNPQGAGGVAGAVRNGGNWLAGTTPVDDGTWHFLTYTDNGTAKSIYVDGNLETLTQNNFTGTDVGTIVQLGLGDIDPFTDGTNDLNGEIDELKFYNTAITPDQVKQLRDTNAITGSSFTILPTTTPVSVAGGAVLDLTAGQVIGSLAGPAGSSVIVESGTLVTGGAGSTVFSGVISDVSGTAPGSSGGLSKVGTGTFTLAGVNTYTGNTGVSAGTLKLMGSPSVIAASKSISIAASATLDASDASVQTGGAFQLVGQTLRGSGAVMGPVALDATSTISPGLGNIGTLSTGALTLSAGTNASFWLGSTGHSGLVAVGGALTLPTGTGAGGTGQVIVNLNDDLGLSGQGQISTGTVTYELFSFASLAHGFDPSEFTVGTGPASLQNTPTYTFTEVGGNQIDVSFNAVVAGPASLTWSGGTAAWDVATTANWNTNTSKFNQGDNVTFDNSNTGSLTVTTGATTVNPGSVTVNSSKAYIFNGTGGIGGSTGITQSGGGSLTITNTNTYTGTTSVSGTGTTLALSSTGKLATQALTVNTGAIGNITGVLTGTPAVTVAGTVTLGANAMDGTNGTAGSILIRNWGALNVSGTLNVAPIGAGNHTSRTVLVTTGLTNTGKIDLSNNDLIVKSTSAGTLVSQLKSGFNAHVGYWDGTTGIDSSSAHSDSRFLTTLGYIQSPGGLVDGVATTTADTLVKYTYYGDANLDGVVNGADYHQIDLGFGTAATGWSNGDFNYDGKVDGSDYALIDNTFNQISATGATALAIVAGPANLIASPADTIVSPSAIPEPTTLGLLGIGAMGLLARRRRRVL